MWSKKDQTICIRYKTDENSFELNPEYPAINTPIEFRKPFVISVTLPHFGVLHGGRLEEVRFKILQAGELERWIISDYGKITIRTEKPKDWQRFLNSNFLQFVGLITAALVGQKQEDFLWVEQSNNGNVWIFGIVWSNEYWEGMLVERKRLDTLPTDYFLTAERDKKEHATELFLLLKSKEEGLGLPDSFPFCSDGLILNLLRHRQLTIKVHPSELWFLLFPIDHFCRFQYGQFSSYKEVEWIVTSKSFIQNTYERFQIQKELSDIEKLLKHSVVIINTYPYFDSLPEAREKCREGTAFVVEILNHFQDIEFDTEEGLEVLSLHWYLNPTKDKIFQLLRDDDIWYFFADFHVKNGMWQLGLGPSDSTSIEFSLNSLKEDDLKHIRLMRVFHCHSVFDPYDSTGEASITRLLLDAGALRVEGSMMDEDYFDYLCSLLYLFCHGEGLQFILMGQCLEKGINFSDTLKRVNNFLKSCNWEIIPQTGC